LFVLSSLSKNGQYLVMNGGLGKIMVNARQAHTCCHLGQFGLNVNF
jgi:hypothetical protein